MFEYAAMCVRIRLYSSNDALPPVDEDASRRDWSDVVVDLHAPPPADFAEYLTGFDPAVVKAYMAFDPYRYGTVTATVYVRPSVPERQIRRMELAFRDVLGLPFTHRTTFAPDPVAGEVADAVLTFSWSPL